MVEVFPPPGAPYTGTLRLAKWERGAVKQEMEFTLPRGVLVRGTVVEAGGKRPVASASLAVAPHGERGPQPHLHRAGGAGWQFGTGDPPLWR